MRPEVSYDREADALYIRLSEARPYEGDDAGPLTLHLDREGRVVGIEVLRASHVLAPGSWSAAAPQDTAAQAMQAAE